MKILALIALLLQPLAVLAQTSPADEATRAVAALDAAGEMLAEAEKSRDQVRALTATIQAFEIGLGAMREGLRTATIAERQLSARLNAREEEIARFLAVLQRLERAAVPGGFVHPSGPKGTVMAGLMLSDLTPALQARAAALRQDVQDLSDLKALQEDARLRLERGLTELQAARAALNEALITRQPPPKRFADQASSLALLRDSSETLTAFATGLSDMALDGPTPKAEVPFKPDGALGLPVEGALLNRAGAADAAGVARPGIILATRPSAIVTLPVAATVRYAGPLLDLGTVVVLEPEPQSLIVLAGLGSLYATAGEVLAAGAPLGLMPGETQMTADSSSPLREGAGAGRTETLYIEVRQQNVPKDPALWFRLDEDG